jgi:hypothetical protein
MSFIACIVGLRIVEASALPTAGDYFRAPILTSVLVSPGGAYLATLGRRWTEDPVQDEVIESALIGSSKISILLNKTETQEISVDFLGSVRYVDWIDDDTLLFSYSNGKGTFVSTVNVGLANGDLELTSRSMRLPGIMIDPLPNQNDTSSGRIEARARALSTRRRSPIWRSSTPGTEWNRGADWRTNSSSRG